MSEPLPIIIGADEVGFGSVFGPLTVCAVANVNNWHHDRVRDSKKIKSEKVMYRLASLISENVMWSLAWASNNVIEEHGLAAALQSAYMKALDGLFLRLDNKTKRPIRVILDGNEMKRVTSMCRSRGASVETIVGADDKVFEVSAASIVAKSARDRFIHELVKGYPSLSAYDLDSCKGYASPKHTEAIIQFGLTAWHRKSACENLVKNKRRKNATAVTAT